MFEFLFQYLGLKRPYMGYFIDIGPGWGLQSNRIWTIEMGPDAISSLPLNNLSVNSQEQGEKYPLLMLHGFASGVGLWAHNLDALSSDRKLYAIDLLGFGRSSRPYFDLKADPEVQLIQSIERWRQKMQLDRKLIILGHSFGGYLAMSYALHFPDSVAGVILADPWGFPSQQQAQQTRSSFYPLPIWVKLIGTLVFNSSTPLAGLRAAGPW